MSSSITGTLIDDYLRRLNNHQDTADDLLSSREREVLQLIAEGKTTKQIGDILNLSVKTIESHRHNIVEKLDIRTTAELTKYAIRTKLTTLDH